MFVSTSLLAQHVSCLIYAAGMLHECGFRHMRTSAAVSESAVQELRARTVPAAAGAGWASHE